MSRLTSHSKLFAMCNAFYKPQYYVLISLGGKIFNFRLRYCCWHSKPVWFLNVVPLINICGKRATFGLFTLSYFPEPTILSTVLFVRKSFTRETPWNFEYAYSQLQIFFVTVTFDISVVFLTQRQSWFLQLNTVHNDKHARFYKIFFIESNFS